MSLTNVLENLNKREMEKVKEKRATCMVEKVCIKRNGLFKTKKIHQ